MKRYFCVFLLLCLSTPAAAQSYDSSTMLMLSWTAPGDDAHVGRAKGYDIRYVLGYELSENEWSSATVVANPPLPSLAGLPDTMLVIGLQPSTTYAFALKAYDELGNTSGISNVLQSMTTGQVGVGDEHVPTYDLAVPTPNPARQSVQLRFSLASPAASVTLGIYDVTGRCVRQLVSGVRPAGIQIVNWNLRTDEGKVASPGLYFVRLTLGASTMTRRIIIVH